MSILASFRKDRRAASAVEFAIVAPLFLAITFMILTVGVILYLNQALDYATSKAARQIMVGAVQKAGLGQAAFVSADLCPYLPAVMSCSNVIVNVQTIVEAAQPAGYYSLVTSNQSGLIIPPLSNSSTQYSLGVQGSYEYLQVIYPLTFIPSMFGALLGNATYNGSTAYLAVSTAAFRNEQY